MHDILSYIPGVIFYLNDILVFRNNEVEQNKNFNNVLRKIKVKMLNPKLRKI